MDLYVEGRLLGLQKHLARVIVDSNAEAPSRPGAGGAGHAASASASKSLESKGTSSAPAARSLSTAELIASEICSAAHQASKMARELLAMSPRDCRNAQSYVQASMSQADLGNQQ